jgi:transposase-like protein/IS1 family transposase
MDPQSVFCHNLDCPARGQLGKGNIGVLSRKDRRYICHVCGGTFSATKGTAFYRLRTAKELIVIVITLLAHGCPVQAIVAAFQLDERTVFSWQKRAGEQCARVHEQLVEQPRDLGQVQADEIRVKKQGGLVWMALALQVSTRLWLGGVLGARDAELITALMQKVKASALCRPLLFCVDGFTTYVGAIQQVFRTPVPTGKVGRPYWRPWEGLCLAQVIKRYAQQRGGDIQRRLAQGTMAQVEALLRRTQGGGQINVAFIERLNATFRSRISALVRRGRALARQTETLHPAMYLMGTVYNFCSAHQSLRLPIYLPANRHHWVGRTPAMAAGITDHLWSVEELLHFQTAIPPWTPPKRRGRPSKATKALVAQWCS